MGIIDVLTANADYTTATEARLERLICEMADLIGKHDDMALRLFDLSANAAINPVTLRSLHNTELELIGVLASYAGFQVLRRIKDTALEAKS